MRTIGAVIGALGLAAALASAVPANANPYVDGGYHHGRQALSRVENGRGHHRWQPVHYTYRHHHRHHSMHHRFYR